MIQTAELNVDSKAYCMGSKVSNQLGFLGGWLVRFFVKLFNWMYLLGATADQPDIAFGGCFSVV